MIVLIHPRARSKKHCKTHIHTRTALQGTMMHALVQYALAVAAKGPLTREALLSYVSACSTSVMPAGGCSVQTCWCRLLGFLWNSVLQFVFYSKYKVLTIAPFISTSTQAVRTCMCMHVVPLLYLLQRCFK